MSVNPISWSDMRAYFNLIQYQPYEWEIELINRLDNVFLNHVQDEREKEEKKKNRK